MNQDGLQLRTEVQIVAAARDVQRLDPHAIASQNQPVVALAPQRNRKHSPQPRETLRVPLQKRIQNRFGVAVRVETISALFQFAAQFQVIVDLSVEDDDVTAIRGHDGLISALYVDNLQPRRAERNVVGLKDALLIRTPMENARNRILNSAGRRGAMHVCKAGYAAQFSSALPSVG